jgi:WhiB family redox-sensing transcriptional regulator
MYTFTTEANCIGTDTEAFFTDDHGAYEHPAMLKRICGECTVQTDCLEYALTHEVKGYWGNTTDQQRIAIRKAKGIVPRRLFEDYNLKD